MTIAGRVVELRDFERPYQPVGEPIPLRWLPADLALVQGGQRGDAETEESGRDLRVEDPLGDRPAAAVENLQILACRMGDHQPARPEHLGQRLHIHRQRIDQDQIARPRDLHQRGLGPEGALPVKLGVERVSRLGDQRAHHLSQPRAGIDIAIGRLRTPLGPGPATAGH